MGNRGFTFIEIILVIVVMGIVIPALIAAVSFITQAQVNPMGTTVATTLAQEGIETAIAQKQSTCATCGYANIATVAPAAVPGFPNYTRRTDVVLVDANMAVSGPDVGYKRVTVTVTAAGVGPSVPDAVLVTVLTNY